MYIYIGIYTFELWLAYNDEGVGLETGEDLWPDEVHDGVVVSEHVDFIDAGNGLDSELPYYLL